MGRHFNTAGPCRRETNYMLPGLRRLPTVRGLIDAEKYFVIHAPRQVGKTTALYSIARELLAAETHVAAVVSLEVGAPYADNIADGEPAILRGWRQAVEQQLPSALQPPPWPDAPEGIRISVALAAWARAAPRPLVLLIDEADSLQGDLLMSILRQLRSGYERRPTDFPAALVLCGMRDVRDYRITEGQRLATASPFNIKVESLTVRNFRLEEVGELYAQHTADTGQVFTPEAVERAFYWTGGQPWLVNALARQAVEELVPERTRPILPETIDAAKEILIQRRDTHLDSLAERLRDPRVRRVIEPILVGDVLPMDVMNDDIAYVRDLGLVEVRPNLRIANPIYQEVIPRSLSYVMQVTMVQEHEWYERPDGSLDMCALLRAFQRFFAEHSEAWLGRYDYHEAGPHLILMAFLQRVVNGGGQIAREFAVGSGRADLVLTWRRWRYVLELKVRHSERSEDDGVAQLGRYLERLGESEGFLVLFDRRPGIAWEQRLFEHTRMAAGRTVHVFGA